MAMLTRRTQLIVAGVTIALGVSLAPVLGASSASATASICSKVTSAEVSSFLGVKATKVSSDVNGSVTVCWYRVGANTQAAFVRIQTGDNRTGFNADRKSAATQGEKPKTDLNFGALPAFSTSLGSASYGYTFSVTLLKKTTELVVGGVTSKLSNVEHLTKKVLLLL
jgi:hypothetical protein